jgi:acetyl-CoA acyltransferase
MRTMAYEAVGAALRDAGVDARAVGAAYVANGAAGLITGQEMIRGQAALRGLGLGGIPMFNIENACASGSSALHLATQAIRSGEHDCALVLGVEKLSHVDKETSIRAIGSATDVEAKGGDGNEATRGRTVFMEFYAAEARAAMQDMGVTREDLAQVAAKNRANGARNGKAHYRGTPSIEEVLQSRTIVDPLTLLMCSPISDGAAAVILMSRNMARRSASERPVCVRGSIVLSGDPDGQLERVSCRAANQAYEEAGLGPDDLDVIELHDAAAPAELIAYEDLGLVPRGHGAELIRTGATSLGRRLPVNTSGGLIARGHPMGATGVAQAVEVVQQLRGVLGERQVQDARVGLCHNNGGIIGPDYAAASVHILTI